MSIDWQSPDNLESLSHDETRSRLLLAQDFSGRISIISELAARMDAARTEDDVLQVIRASAKRLLPGEAAFIGLFNDDRSAYVVQSLTTLMDHAVSEGREFPVSSGIIGWVLQSNSAVVVEMDSAPTVFSPFEARLKDLGVQSMILVPMKTSEESLGVLAFGSMQSGHYGDPDLWLGQLVAMLVAIVLRNVRSIKKMRKRIIQIALVNEIARRIATSLDLSTLFVSAAEAIQKTFNYFDVTIFLLTPDRRELELVAQKGNYNDFLPPGYRQAVGRGIIGWVAEHGHYALANDVSQDSRYMAYLYHDTRAEIAVPIRIDGEVVGVINVEDTRKDVFDEIDVLVLETLCDQIGGAIRNARLFEEIKQVNQQLLEFDRLKTEFVSIVSHDFRTPLSTIMLAAKSLIRREESIPTDKLKEYLNIIVDQAGKLSKLAEDTLSIARIESGQLNYQFKFVNVETIVREAASMVKFPARHSFSYTIDINASYVRGDQNKLRQVLQNLVSNAVKYSPDGGRVTVDVRPASDAPDEVVFSVSDEGIGIPAEQEGKLFQKFSRVETGRAKEIQGSGLGLWICNEIIKVHGGRIWVERNAGRGSTFRFSVKRGEA